MSQITMKQLLEAGVHFGHQTSRWNPKMRPYIFGARNGIHIIDLQQTVALFREACAFVQDLAGRGGAMLFVGTKRQARDPIRNEAVRCGQFYVNNRWLGGTLTNFQTIKQSIDRLSRLEETLADPQSAADFKKKERLMMQRDVDKLRFNLEGIRAMKRPPDAMFVVDPRREEIAVNEANRLSIPVVAVVDTNCDPDRIAYSIPGNDDAIRAIRLFCTAMADSFLLGQREQEERERAAQKDPGVGLASSDSLSGELGGEEAGTGEQTLATKEQTNQVEQAPGAGQTGAIVPQDSLSAEQRASGTTK